MIKNEKPLIKAVIGLGNPGNQYKNNRHNIGSKIIDKLAEEFNVKWNDSENMSYSEINLFSTETNEVKKIFLIKPKTFMNNSGKATNFLTKKGIKPEEILVIHDELEKDFGKTGLKLNGSAKGHNGLKSIITHIGSNFWKFYFGIGRPNDKNDVSSYVLSNFSKNEEIAVQDLLSESINFIKGLLE